MKILQETESPLFDRKNLILEIEYAKGATPKKDEIKKQIASKFKVNENQISIEHTKTNFGGKFLKVECDIYKNEALLKKFEIKKKEVKAKSEEVPKEGKKNAKEAKKAA